MLSAFSWSDMQEIGVGGNTGEWWEESGKGGESYWTGLEGWPLWNERGRKNGWVGELQTSVQNSTRPVASLWGWIDCPWEESIVGQEWLDLVLCSHCSVIGWDNLGGGVALASLLRDWRCGDWCPLWRPCSPLSGASSWLPQTRLSMKATSVTPAPLPSWFPCPCSNQLVV